MTVKINKFIIIYIKKEGVPIMKSLAIISEYNPCHKGHAYQIEKARELSGSDIIIALMSGNFVQRGIPAVLINIRGPALLFCQVQIL